MKYFKFTSRYRNLVCGFTDKTDGNLGFKYDIEHTALENRLKLTRKLGFSQKRLFEMQQVHGSKLTAIDENGLGNCIPGVDGLLSSKPDTYLMVKTADCFPVVMFDPEHRVIAAVHVGWRGALEKIFLEALLRMVISYQSDPKKILAGIGPGARNCCYYYDRNDFVQEKLPEWNGYAGVKNFRTTIDIPRFIIDKLALYGVVRDNIEDCGICTIHNQDYFSHYRSLNSKEPEGRGAAIIGIQK